MFVNVYTTACMFTNIYPYLKSLNQDTSDFFYSCVIAVYPLGMFMSSPLLGYWFNISSTRQPIVFVLVLVIISNIIYVYCNQIPGNVAIWIVLISRFLMGVASGCRATISAYVTAATTMEERTGVMTNVYLTIPLAFTIGPLMGLLFEPLGSVGYVIPLIHLSLNIYTCPIIVCACVALINLVLMIWFKEFLVITLTTRNTSKLQKANSKFLEYAALMSESSEQTPPIVVNKPYDRIGFWSLVFTSFCAYLLVTINDSLLTPVCMDEFGWTSVQTITFNNLLISICCLLGMGSMRVFTFLVKYVEERSLFLLEIMTLSIAFFLYIPWPGELPELIHPLDGSSNSTIEMVGCDYKVKPWCLWVPKIHLFQYILGTIIFCTNFPNVYSGSNTIASKVIGTHPPGLLMGALTAGISVGRCVGPIIFIFLYSNYGPQITFGAMTCVVISMILITLVTYKRIAPYSNFE
ncbi:Major facilitator superfamily domain-containing protein 8-like [Oopsacas minuta]|uniref:Major facilitator superfamily domain-containing protein 8-like n=1 Tax=Oopsacas minuta TaxID=111878 RepID=A0AAV7K3C7_9METZ|nr:Major facilitator superfamily domain-containing protein 8-like [Oopsacas minuta]